MSDHNYSDDDLFNPETHHESSDVPVRPLWWALIIFVVFAIVTHLVLGFMYKGFVAAERKRMDPPETAIARPANADVPQNQPLLQPFQRGTTGSEATMPQVSTPVTDMKAMRAAEAKTLDNYGWVDRQRGTVHIPIEQAKALLAARLAVEGQLAPTAPATQLPGAPATPGAIPSPAGNPVTPGTGAIPGPATGTAAPATTTGTTTTSPAAATATATSAGGQGQ